MMSRFETSGVKVARRKEADVEESMISNGSEQSVAFPVVDKGPSGQQSKATTNYSLQYRSEYDMSMNYKVAAAALFSKPLKRTTSAKRCLQNLFDGACSNQGLRHDSMMGSQESNQTDIFDCFKVSEVSDNSRGSSFSQGEETSGSIPTIPFAPLTELLHSERGGTMKIAEYKTIIYSLVEDLAYLHSKNLVHHSISLSTAVLQVQDGMARASLLFGEANVDVIAPKGRNINRTNGPGSGMHPYIAPEIVYCSQFDELIGPKANMWSLGCLVFEILSGGEKPFGELGIGVAAGEILFLSIDRQQRWLQEYINAKILKINKLVIANKSLEQQGFVNHGNSHLKAIGFDEAAVNLIHKLLNIDPAQRIGASEVLSNSFLMGVSEIVPRFKTMSLVTPMDVAYGSKEPGKKLKRVEDFPNAHQCEKGANDAFELIGQVKKPIEVTINGEVVTTLAIHAVYSVPNRGPLVSVEPIAIETPKS